MRFLFDQSSDLVQIVALDNRLLYVNPTWQKVLGYEAKAISAAAVSFLSVLHPDDRDRYRQTCAQLQQEGDRCTLSLRLLSQTGETVAVTGQLCCICAGEPQIACLWQRSQPPVEQELQQAKERYSLATRAARVGVWEWQIQSGKFFLDPTVKAILGYSDAEIPNDLNQWTNHVHPDDRQTVTAAVQAHLQGETPEFVCEHRMLHKDGTIRWILARGLAIRNAQGEVVRMVGTDTDTTDRKRSEILLELQNRSLASIAAGAPPTQTWLELMSMIESQIEGSLSSILLIDSSGRLRQGAAPRLPSSYSQAIEGVAIGEGVGSCGTAAVRRTAVIVSDINTDPLWQNYKSLALAYSLQACWSVPLIAANDRVLGTFAVYFQTVRSPRDGELEVLNLAGNIARIAIERHQAEANLRNSEARLRAIIEDQTELICRCLSDGTLTFANQAYCRYFGKPAEELLGQSFMPLLAPEDRQVVRQAFSQITTDHPFAAYEVRMLVNGVWRWQQWTDRGVFDAQGRILEYQSVGRDITDRKRNEANLQFQATILNQIHDAVMVTDLSGTITHWNRGAEQVYGYSAAEAIGRSMAMLYFPRDWTMLQTEVIPPLRQRGQWEIELPHRHRSGRRIEMDLRLSLLKDASGMTIGMISCSHDITQRKRAEQQLQQLNQELEVQVEQRTAQLRDSEAKFRNLVEQASDMIFQVNLDGYFSYVSPTFRAWMGYELTAMVGHHFAAFVHPADLHVYRAALHRILTTGDRQINLEYRVRHQQGHWCWQKTSVSPLRSPSQKIVGLIGVARDITDLKIAEESLRQSEARYRRIVETAGEGIWIIDADNKTTFVNRSMAQMLGTTPDAMLGRCMFDFMDDSGRQVAETLLQRPRQGIGEQRDFRFKRADRSDLWTIAACTPIFDADGGYRGALTMMTDITERKRIEDERKRAEAQLQQMNETLAIANAELARANRLKDEFLANMSHELRTPLSSIMGLSEVLQTESFGSLTAKQRQFVDTIYSSGNHLLALINDILDLAKIEAGKFDLALAPASLQTICESSLVFVRQQAQHKNILLQAHLPPHPISVTVDERRLRQVLINLLSNGVKFTPDGGSVTLQVEPDADCGLLWLHIIDTGIGIADSDRGRLFQPFVQIDSSLSRRYEGTGLGLTLVKQIVELHGGSISVESQPGQGSCFTVALPWHGSDLLAIAGSDSTSAHSDDRAESAASLDSHCLQQLTCRPLACAALSAASPVLLLADDNPDARSLLQDYLQMHGFRVLLSKNGIDALERVNRHRPDLVLMDIHMPEMDGLETIRRLRCSPATAAIPVIALTALAMPGDRDRCLAAGASDYLSKPMNLQELLHKVNRLLGQQI